VTTQKNREINQIRQGDVLLVRVDPPRQCERIMENGRPLAGLTVDGERTGHAHVLPARVYGTPDGGRLLMLERPETLTHEEHAHVEVPAGWWRPIIQREYVPAARPQRRRD
jgi:hypothetical protein